MTLPIAAGSVSWYLTRGSAAVVLLLLTASVVLGIANWRRWERPGWPRFVVDRVHRNVSLLALSFLAVHIVSAVLDTFAPISLVSVVVPFTSHYRPLWIGFGALAFDLLLAVLITSLLRARIGFGAWRRVHWLSYAAWPIALLHGLGSGSDIRSTWMLVLVGICVAAVWLAVWTRVMASEGAHRARRRVAIAVAAAAPLALLVWLPQGPLAKGWAARAGTPKSLLAQARVAPAASRTSTASTRALDPPFQATLSGTASQSSADANGLAAVDLNLRLSGGASGVLKIRIQGPASSGGGISMQSSRVTLGSAAQPSLYSGQITALNGTSLSASLHGASGRQLRLGVNMQIDGGSGAVTGSVRGSSAGAA